MLHQIVGQLLRFAGQSVCALGIAIFQRGMRPHDVVPDLSDRLLLSRVEAPPGDLLKIGFRGCEQLFRILALVAGLRLGHTGNELHRGFRSAALTDHDFVRRPGNWGRKVFVELAFVGGCWSFLFRGRRGILRRGWFLLRRCVLRALVWSLGILRRRRGLRTA